MDDTAASAGDSVSTPEDLWLTGTEQEAWRTFLYATTLLTDRFGEALQVDPEIDLTLGEYEILVRLSEAEKKFLRMSELADKVVHSRSRLTHTVSRMEKRGLVERVRCSDDGRGRQAQLTGAGEAMLVRAAPRMCAPCASCCWTSSGTTTCSNWGESWARRSRRVRLSPSGVRLLTRRSPLPADPKVRLVP